MHLRVIHKFWIALAAAVAWVSFAIIMAQPWIHELSQTVGSMPIALAIIIGIAIIPGFANAFIMAALVMDNRPQYDWQETLPDISIIIAAYNEETAISDTLHSIVEQEYPGFVNVFVVDDGSVDNTAQVALDWVVDNEIDHTKFKIQILRQPTNQGKSAALNLGLTQVTTGNTITLDADTYLYKHALRHLVTNMVCSPDNTAAVAGSILVRNSRENFLTGLQEWDFFQGISVVKRIQSMFGSTLVAQGAFSLYDTEILRECGGWCNSAIGEDIVLTWNLRAQDYRVSYSEHAMAFTNVPTTYKGFFKQRERWSRGLIEAFRRFPGVLKQFNTTSPFVWINLTFPYMDLIFLFVFLPGVIAALFGYYAIAGPMTLMLLPIAFAMNWLMFKKQKSIFEANGLEIRDHWTQFGVYLLAYSVILTPATVLGYWKEIFGLKGKTWGTK